MKVDKNWNKFKGFGMKKVFTILFCLILIACSAPLPQSLATPVVSCQNPQYEGFGSGVTGGEGQPIYRVTTLADSGTGSLRTALSSGNRCIVFDVSGTITLNSDLTVKGKNITIDGLSSPRGITVTGYALSAIGASGAGNLIVRGLRVRNTVGDGIRFYGLVGGVADHNSVTGFGDGAIDVTESSKDITNNPRGNSSTPVKATIRSSVICVYI